MPKYQVIRNVDIVCEVTATSKEDAKMVALEVESQGKAEFCWNKTTAVMISKEPKVTKRKFEIVVTARTTSKRDATKEEVADALCVENLDYGNIGLDFTSVKITSSAVCDSRIIITYCVTVSGFSDRADLGNDMRAQIDEMIMWWCTAWDNYATITVKALDV